jgi:GNAT superfamily N-acetyltransferase
VRVAYAGIFPATAPLPELASVVREWEKEFADPTAAVFLAEDDEDGRAAVGTVAVRADPEDLHPNGRATGQLRRLHVLPRLWGRGLGAALYAAAETTLRDAGYEAGSLWVLEGNGRARSFYERRGWTLVPGRTLTWPNGGPVEVRYRLVIS